MKLFGRRAAELETKNRLLIETDKIRSARVQKLELELERAKTDPTFFSDRVAQLEKQVQKLEQELKAARDARVDPAVSDIVRLKAEYSNSRTELDSLRTERDSLRTERDSLQADRDTQKAERNFYFRQMTELREHNRELTETATKYSLHAQELDLLLCETKMKEKERLLAWENLVAWEKLKSDAKSRTSEDFVVRS